MGEGDDEEGGRPGGTLILRVDPARALDVEYRARQIIDRINAYFGYRAVETLKIVQAPLPKTQVSKSSPAPSSERPFPAQQQTASAPALPADDPLAAALARMEKSVLARQTARPR
jgi:hypothetical protein